MAQNIFHFPVAFEFRTGTVDWAPAPAHMVGWWKRDDDSVDSEYLAAAIDGSRERLKIPLGMLTSDLNDACYDAFLYSDDDEPVQELCSNFRLNLLFPSKKHLSVTQCRPADAWEMRDDFLRMSPDEAGAIGFLNKWGQWTGSYARVSDLVRLQKVVRLALISSPARWLTDHRASPYLWQRLPDYPHFAVITNNCETAIRMTVTIDLVRRLKFKICSRRDCALPFPITSKHKRRYCSQYCAHLESVRRTRREQQKLAAREQKGRG